MFSSVVFGAMAIGQASSFAPDASKAQASAVNIFQLLDSEPAIDVEKTDGLKLQEVYKFIKNSRIEKCYPVSR